MTSLPHSSIFLYDLLGKQKSNNLILSYYKCRFLKTRMIVVHDIIINVVQNYGSKYIFAKSWQRMQLYKQSFYIRAAGMSNIAPLSRIDCGASTLMVLAQSAWSALWVIRWHEVAIEIIPACQCIFLSCYPLVALSLSLCLCLCSVLLIMYSSQFFPASFSMSHSLSNSPPLSWEPSSIRESSSITMSTNYIFAAICFQYCGLICYVCSGYIK